MGTPVLPLLWISCLYYCFTFSFSEEDVLQSANRRDKHQIFNVQLDQRDLNSLELSNSKSSDLKKWISLLQRISDNYLSYKVTQDTRMHLLRRDYSKLQHASALRHLLREDRSLGRRHNRNYNNVQVRNHDRFSGTSYQLDSVNPTPVKNFHFLKKRDKLDKHHRVACSEDIHHYCLNGGKCYLARIQTEITLFCQCLDGFTGRYCEQKDLSMYLKDFETFLPRRWRYFS